LTFTTAIALKTFSVAVVIPDVDIWRAADLMLKRYRDKPLEEGSAPADELAAGGDHKDGQSGAVSAMRLYTSPTKHHPGWSTDREMGGPFAAGCRRRYSNAIKKTRSNQSRARPSRQ
jgi:hypothetical protein